MMYWAVPVFFMITGMLFLRKEMHVKSSEWLFKYSRRILLALVVFGIPYAALKLVMADGLSISLLDKAILAFLSDTGFGHLWYLYALIVKERIEGGANEKAVLRLFINCPFVCINFDFFWLNKARQLYMDF